MVVPQHEELQYVGVETQGCQMYDIVAHSVLPQNVGPQVYQALDSCQGS